MPADPLQMMVLPLFFALAGLFFAATLYDQRNFRRRKHEKETIYRCADCRRIYTDTHRTPLAGCPRCGRQNPAVRQR